MTTEASTDQFTKGAIDTKRDLNFSPSACDLVCLSLSFKMLLYFHPPNLWVNHNNHNQYQTVHVLHERAAISV